MAILGETKRAGEIGFKQPGHLYQWCACLDCSKERWVMLVKGKPIHQRCKSCARKLRVGKYGPCWKEGRIGNTHGYIQIRLPPDDFFRPMAQKNGYVLEHRLVIAKALGRCLHSWEIVHHKGAKYSQGSIENKQDNRYPENLQLVTDDRHKQITILEMQIKRLKAENQALREKLQS